MKLYGTPRSHFTRKIRILLDHYGADYEFVDIGNVAQSDVSKFANNPLMRVPVLEDAENWVVDSDHIAEYLVKRLDRPDRYEVLHVDVNDRNIRAVLNGIMLEEVSLIIAGRLGTDTSMIPYFQKSLKAIETGLQWLEVRAEEFRSKNPRYKDFHLVCLWQHLETLKILPLPYPRLKRVVDELLKNPVLAQSAPPPPLNR